MIFEITGPPDVAGAVASFDLGRPRPVLIVVGGADGLDEVALAPIFAEVIARPCSGTRRPRWTAAPTAA